MPAAPPIAYERRNAVHASLRRSDVEDEPRGADSSHFTASTAGRRDALTLCATILSETREAAVVIDSRGAIVRANRAYQAREDFFGAVVADIVARLARVRAVAAPLRGSAENVTLAPSENLTFGMWHDVERERVGALFCVREIVARDQYWMIALRKPGEALLGCDQALLEQTLGLTPAEARLACALIRLKSLPAAIRELGLKEKTGRTYLDRIFSKTGSKSQLQLYAMLMDIFLLAREQA